MELPRWAKRALGRHNVYHLVSESEEVEVEVCDICMRTRVWIRDALVVDRKGRFEDALLEAAGRATTPLAQHELQYLGVRMAQAREEDEGAET